MKTTIYYFTGTGNSLMAARHLSQCLPGDISLEPISGSLNKEKINIESEALGLVFPVYFGTVPDIVKEFIAKLRFQSNPYVFAIATCNGEPLYTMEDLEKSLKKTGTDLSYGYCLDMPGNALVTPDNLILSRLSQYKANLRQAAKHIDSRYIEKSPRKHQLIRYLQMNFLYWFGNNHYISPKQFYASDNCIGCGKCAQVCPTQNILLNDRKRPEWKNQCARCLACFHWCPKCAVRSRGKALNRNQYHHPEVSYKDIQNSVL